MYEKILVPVDGSDHSSLAVKAAAELVGKMGFTSTITLLHVNPNIHFIDTAGVDIDQIDVLLEKEGKQILSPAQQLLTEQGITHKSIYKTGEPAEQISSVSKEFDLIIMGIRGLSPLGEVVFGSVSHKVIQTSACPVLIIK
jgi:nucleotide-binding universal stress UspA family protein